MGKILDFSEANKLLSKATFYSFNRYVSRVSINGKEATALNNLPGANDYRSPSTSHNAIPLRYQSNNWKNSSGASSGASTGVSPIHSSNEDHNGEERFVTDYISNKVSS